MGYSQGRVSKLAPPISVPGSVSACVLFYGLIKFDDKIENVRVSMQIFVLDQVKRT